MDRKSRVVFQKKSNYLNKLGYINLNNQVINGRDNFVDLSSIFRNPNYETFRIIYMQDNRIVGNEAISSRLPDRVYMFGETSSNQRNHNYEKCYYKINNRMKRLNANSYYLAHNHPSDNAKTSNHDVKLTKEFIKHVDGFLGHVIVNCDTYAWIGKNKDGECTIENYIPVPKKQITKTKKRLEKKSVYDLKINNRKDLVALVHCLKNSKNYSTAILTSATNEVKMVVDIPNNYFNMNEKQLKGYFRNLAKQSGSCKIHFATSNFETYEKAKPLYKDSIFEDMVCYKNKDGKTYIFENFIVRNKKKLFDSDSDNIEYPIQNNNTIIKNYAFTIGEESDYEELELEDLKQKSLTILYKKVGEKPKKMTIKNTLEAKQELVGGLIEVVPYKDVFIVCNEEGKLLNMPPNVVFDYDYIAGDLFVIGDDYENADFKSLTDKEIKLYTEDLEKRKFKPYDFTIREYDELEVKRKYDSSNTKEL